MVRINFENAVYQLNGNQSILDLLLSEGENIPWSCKSGICHLCMLKSCTRSVTRASTQGLSSEQIREGFFLSCQCYPASDMIIQRCKSENKSIMAIIVALISLNELVKALVLKPVKNVDFFPGQLLFIRYKEMNFRCYIVLTSSALGHPYITIHVARHFRGVFSEWLFCDAKIGSKVLIKLVQTCRHGQYFKVQHHSNKLIVVGSDSGCGAAQSVAVATLDSMSHKNILLILFNCPVNIDKGLSEDVIQSRGKISIIYETRFLLHKLQKILAAYLCTEKKWESVSIVLFGVCVNKEVLINRISQNQKHRINVFHKY